VAGGCSIGGGCGLHTELARQLCVFVALTMDGVLAQLPELLCGHVLTAAAAAAVAGVSTTSLQDALPLVYQLCAADRGGRAAVGTGGRIGVREGVGAVGRMCSCTEALCMSQGT
jgi:hypothetical protein